MNLRNLTPTRALARATAVLAATVLTVPFGASAQVVLNESAGGSGAATVSPGDLLNSARGTDTIELNKPADGTVITLNTPGAAVPMVIPQAASASAPLDTTGVTFGIFGQVDVDEGTETNATDRTWVGTVNLADGTAPGAIGGFMTQVEAVAEMYDASTMTTTILDSTTNTVTVDIGNSTPYDPTGDASGSSTAFGALAPNPGDAGSFSNIAGTVTNTLVNLTGGSSVSLVVPSVDGFEVTITLSSQTTVGALSSDVATADAFFASITTAPSAGDLATGAEDAESAAGLYIRVVHFIQNGAAFTAVSGALPDGTVTYSVEIVGSSLTEVTQLVRDVDADASVTPFTYDASSSDWSEDGSATVSGSTASGSIRSASSLTAFDTGGAGDDGGSDDTCFIATAAYGTPMAQEINTLRSVRDSYLLNNALGSAFVDTYYRLSPVVADKVAESPALAAVVRAALTPFILVGKLILAAPMALMAFVIAGAGLALARRKARGQQS